MLELLAPQIAGEARRASLRAGVSERDLYKQLLLHLPRLPWNELTDPDGIAQEAERRAQMLLADRKGFESWASRPKVQELAKSNAFVGVCDPVIAREIHQRFHYIRSHHAGLVDFALYLLPRTDIPAALSSFAPMDIRHLDGLFASAEEKKRALVLTRLFAFDWAPRNSISYLLGQAYRLIRRVLPEAATLLTYVNPNLGFTGSSFLAANWRPFLAKGVRYSYFQDTYITYRGLCALPPSAWGEVTHSLYELEALKILRFEMDTRSRSSAPVSLSRRAPWV